MASDQNRLRWGCCPKSGSSYLVSSLSRFLSHALDTMLKFVGCKMFMVSFTILVLIMIDEIIVWSVERFRTRCLSQLSLLWCWWLSRCWDADDLGMLMIRIDADVWKQLVTRRRAGWAHTMLAPPRPELASEHALELALKLALEHWSLHWSLQ